MRLTLRTLLAYLDDTLSPGETRQIGHKVAENAQAQELIERIKQVTRRRRLATPPTGQEGSPSDPNTVAEYLSDALDGDPLTEFEETCLRSDVHLAEVAACHQILTLVLSEQVRVPPTARQRMYRLVKGRESVPNRRPGNTIPVGGAREDDRPADPDDTDAPLLLGFSAYSQSDSSSQRFGRLAAVAALLLGTAAAVWMAWPGADPAPLAGPPRYAVVTPPTTVASTPTKKADPPGKTPTPTPHTVPGAVNPPATPNGPSEPRNDAAPPDSVPAPKTDRTPIGRSEKPATVLVRKPATGGDWERVPAADPVVQSADRLVSLPGYKSAVRLDTGVLVELWGNVPPDLIPAPLYEASVTPFIPPDGFHADLQVNAGRILLSTPQKTGSKVRLRFGSEVCDVTLADEKTKVVFELIPVLAPGPVAGPPITQARLVVTAGKATVTARGVSAAELPRGGNVIWVGPNPEVRTNPPPAEVEARTRELSEFPVYADAQRAKLTLEVLDDMAKRMTDPTRVRAVIDEDLQDRPNERPTDKSVLANRIGVFALGALGDVSKLVDALTNPTNPIIRQTAVEALRATLASDPGQIEAFKQVMTVQRQQSAEDTDTLLRLLRGVGPEEAGDPATVDRLVSGLSSASQPMRELAYQNLLGYLTPDDRGNRRLVGFDSAGTDEQRAPVVKEWRQKAEAIKKRLTEPPPEKK
jgi:hypothetical protein